VSLAAGDGGGGWWWVLDRWAKHMKLGAMTLMAKVHNERNEEVEMRTDKVASRVENGHFTRGRHF